jgi:hypothetical protein
VSAADISRFAVDSLTVDATIATLAPPGIAADDLANGSRVAVTGTLPSGLVPASTVMLVR